MANLWYYNCRITLQPSSNFINNVSRAFLSLGLQVGMYIHFLVEKLRMILMTIQLSVHYNDRNRILLKQYKSFNTYTDKIL